MTLYSELKGRLVRGKIVVLGIGDVKMRDDGIGPYVIATLHEKLPPLTNVKLVNGGTVPELFREEIIDYQPAHILIIDAAEMKASPGTIQIVERKNMGQFLPTSSHLMPMTLTVDWLKSALPQVDVLLLAIQPENLNVLDEDLELAGDGSDFLDSVEEDPLKPFFRFKFSPTVDVAVIKVVLILLDLLGKIG